MKRLLAAAAVLATLTHSAFAGEITLFGDADFRGPRVTLQSDARDLRELNFNDRVSSLVVRSGTWELCADSYFRGRCVQIGPGEYRSLPNFNDAISSLREVRGAAGWRGDDRDARREEWREREERREREARREEWRREHGEGYRDGYGGGAPGYGDPRGGAPVQLFAGPRFEGPQVAVAGDVRSMSDIGFNDRAVSIVIREGRWEFCEHGDFRGQCVVYGPGQYPFLEGMNNRISSMRRVR